MSSPQQDLASFKYANYFNGRDSVDSAFLYPRGATVPSGVSAAAYNTAVLQAAANTPGYKTFVVPGNYQVTADAFTYNADSLIGIGPGVEFYIGDTLSRLTTLEPIIVPASGGTFKETTVAASEARLIGGDSLFVNTAGAASSLILDLPENSVGRLTVANGDGLSATDVSAVSRPSCIRMANSGSSIVLPSINAVATANVGWTFGILVRLNVENLQAGTTHLRFLQVGTAPAYAMLGYEGPNASNPFVMKALFPNAAASGVVSLRQGLNSTFSPFHTSRLGQWAWVFLRKHDVAVVEDILSLSNGQVISGSFTDETITLAWAPIQSTLPGAAPVVYSGSSGIAAGSFGAANAAVTLGPDSSVTGEFDIAKVFFLNQCLSIANLGKMATGRRPQDLGLTVNNTTDIYYDLTTLTAANLLDICGGTAATSVTMAGADGLSPVTARPRVASYLGNTGATKLEAVFADGMAVRI